MRVGLPPYDPVEAGHQFHEGGAYQYQWLVPQDPAGLVGLMGGKAATTKRLDDFFVYDKLLTDPAGTARTDWIASPYDYYAKATYNPNNEPDLLAPYLYLWAGAPAKTATVVRAAMTQGRQHRFDRAAIASAEHSADAAHDQRFNGT